MTALAWGLWAEWAGQVPSAGLEPGSVGGTWLEPTPGGALVGPGWWGVTHGSGWGSGWAEVTTQDVSARGGARTRVWWPTGVERIRTHVSSPQGRREVLLYPLFVINYSCEHGLAVEGAGLQCGDAGSRP